MSITNFVSLYSVPTATGFIHYAAGAGLMNLLKSNNILPIDGVNYHVSGTKRFFKNKGTCTISFLPDGRIHVMDAPMAMWTLHDTLSPEELRILIAFAAMDEESQTAMRNALAPFCDSYYDVMPRLTKNNTPWKNNFLNEYNAVEVV